MTTRSLVKMVIGVGLVWTFLLGPGVFTYFQVLRHAGGYRKAELTVTETNCIGGDVTRDSQGRTSHSPRYCFLKGTLSQDGVATGAVEEVSIGSTLPPDKPVGTRLQVFYNPELSPFGMNYLNLRVLPAEGNLEPGVMAPLWILAACRMILISLATLVLVHVLLRLRLCHVSRDRQRLTLDLGGGFPVGGTVLLSQGLALLVAQGRNPAWGGVVLGLLLAGAGVPLLVRRAAFYDRADDLKTRALHLFGFTFHPEASVPFEVTAVALGLRHGGLLLRLEDDAHGETTLQPASYAAGKRLAVRAAAFFEVPLEVEERASVKRSLAEARPSRKPALRTLRRLALVLAVVAGLAAAAGLAFELLPAVRTQAVRTLLSPFSGVRGIAPLRRLVLSRLRPEPATVLELVRLLNVADPARDPELVADLERTALRLAGLAPTPEQGRLAGVDAVNRWAAGRLGRRLDANGGVLGWYAVEPRFVAAVDALASSELSDGWSAWSGLAAGDVRDPEQFLYAMGAALGDTRPIHFAIFPVGSSFEAQPEAISSRADACARTVGEAVALRLALYVDVGADGPQNDFWSWWRQWARAHRLPPPPEPAALPLEAPQ